MTPEQLEKGKNLEDRIKILNEKGILRTPVCEDTDTIKLKLEELTKPEGYASWKNQSYGNSTKTSVEKLPEKIEQWLDEELLHIATRLQEKVQKHIKSLEADLSDRALSPRLANRDDRTALGDQGKCRASAGYATQPPRRTTDWIRTAL